MEKLYSAEDLEFGKYYVRGASRFYRLLNRDGREVESYSGAIFKVYKFEIFTLETGTWDYEEIVLNPKYTPFTDVDDFQKRKIKDMIWSKNQHLKSLNRILGI